jgi:hypothetical protein
MAAITTTNWRVSNFFQLRKFRSCLLAHDGFRQLTDAVACQLAGSNSADNQFDQVPVQVEGIGAGKIRKRTVFRPPKRHGFPASLKRAYLCHAGNLRMSGRQ